MSYLAMSEETVVVEQVIVFPDGTRGVGNCIEVSQSDAVSGIKAGSLKAVGFPYGEIPPAWSGRKKKVVEVVEDGEHITRSE